MRTQSKTLETMATEKTILTAPVEPVGTVAEDAKTMTTNNETTTPNEATTEPLAEPMSEAFAQEEAELAASEAGLDLGEETSEEEAARTKGDDLSGLDEEGLVKLFAEKIKGEEKRGR